MFDKASDFVLIKLIKEKHIQSLENYFTFKKCCPFISFKDLPGSVGWINEKDNESLVHATYSHLVQGQQVEQEASVSIFSLSWL